METFCSIKDGSCVAIGDLTHVIKSTFNWFLDEKRNLIVKVSGFGIVKFHSYSKHFSDDEIIRDVNYFLVVKAKDFGLTIFKEF